MGLLLLFVSASFVLEVYRLIGYMASLIVKKKVLTISPLAFVLIAAGYTVIVGIYSWNEARNVRVEHITIKTDKLPSDIPKLRIVQISDVHMGEFVGKARVNNIVNIIKSVNPDILISTGDLVDGQLHHFSGMYEGLQSIRPPFGKFAILGNHEYYAGVSQAEDFTRKCGFIILNNKIQNIPGLLNIIGIDDAVYQGGAKSDTALETSLLNQADKNLFTLILKHRPIVTNSSIGHFDLQLSGHTHGGQIFPFNLFVKLQFPFVAGFFNLKSGSMIYVNRGAGTWGPPMRFLAPPEVTVIDLVKK